MGDPDRWFDGPWVGWGMVKIWNWFDDSDRSINDPELDGWEWPSLNFFGKWAHWYRKSWGLLYHVAREIWTVGMVGHDQGLSSTIFFIFVLLLNSVESFPPCFRLVLIGVVVGFGFLMWGSSNLFAGGAHQLGLNPNLVILSAWLIVFEINPTVCMTPGKCASLMGPRIDDSWPKIFS